VSSRWSDPRFRTRAFQRLKQARELERALGIWNQRLIRVQAQRERNRPPVVRR